jgi:hypothetical protein
VIDETASKVTIGKDQASQKHYLEAQTKQTELQSKD